MPRFSSHSCLTLSLSSVPLRKVLVSSCEKGTQRKWHTLHCATPEEALKLKDTASVIRTSYSHCTRVERCRQDGGAIEKASCFLLWRFHRDSIGPSLDVLSGRYFTVPGGVRSSCSKHHTLLIADIDYVVARISKCSTFSPFRQTSFKEFTYSEIRDFKGLQRLYRSHEQNFVNKRWVKRLKFRVSKNNGDRIFF